MPIIPIKNPDISEEESTYITSAVAVAAASITVSDYEGFTNADYGVLGTYGQEQTEIVSISDASIDATIVLATGKPIYAHPAYTKFTKIPWNQVKIWSAATQALCDAKTISSTVLATASLEVDEEYTYYNDTTGDEDTWYRVAFYNSTAATYSDLSDSVQATGYKKNSRGRMKSLVRSLFGDPNEKWVTAADLDNFFYHIESEILNFRKRWTFEQKTSTYDLSIGKTIYALTDVASDIKETEKKYVSQVYIENNQPLIYLDRKQMNEKKQNAKWTTVAATTAIGATTMTVDDASILDSADTVLCGGENDIAYTSLSTTTNILSGVTGITAAKAIGDEVWADEEGGEPTYYTIWGGNIEFDCPMDEAYTLHIDFTKAVTPMNSDGDVSEIPFTQLVITGVLALCQQAKGDTTMYDKKWSEFTNELKERSYAERSGQRQTLVPSEEEGYRLGSDYLLFDQPRLPYQH